jgi:hypothetical protein
MEKYAAEILPAKNPIKRNLVNVIINRWERGLTAYWLAQKFIIY